MQCWSGRGPRAAVGVAVLGLLALAPRPVAACMVDNIPSITASGRTAVFSATPSGPVNPAHYAPFMIPGLFGAGWTVHFGERTQVLKLPARLLNAPWRWAFGDGTISHGHTLTHVYRTPGDYVVTVAAEVAHQPAPVPFDRVLVHVLAPNRILAITGSYLRTVALPLLQREASSGTLASVSQSLAALENSPWPSIRDYWLHMRGSLPPAYAHVAALLRQLGAAVVAHNQQQAAATADALLAAWPGVNGRQTVRASQMSTVHPRHTGLPWLPIGAGAAGLLLALLIAKVVHGWRTQERLRVSAARHEP
jgi:PKD domain